MTAPPLPSSLWTATAEPAAATPPLAGETRARVAIIGGGFTGLSTALHLAEAGIETMLLEAGEPGWGASGRNGGQIIPGTKYAPDDLAALLGPGIGEKAAAFADGTADMLFALIARHRIACHARRCGWVKAAHTEAKLAELEVRAAEQKRLGADVAMLDRSELGRRLGTAPGAYVGGLLDRRGGALQPLSYARGLAHAALRLGARIHGGTRAARIAREGSGWRVEAASGAVRAERLLIATNAYTDTLWPGLRRTVIPMSSVQIATAPLDARQRESILPEGHASSDTRRLLLYFRLDPEGRLVFGGRGAVFAGKERRAYAAVARGMQRLFPASAGSAIAFRWSGQVALTPDAVPHIWRLAPNATAALGYNGHGVAMTTALGARLAGYLASGAEEQLPFPLLPLRTIPFHGLRLPAIAAAVQYHRLRDAVGG